MWADASSKKAQNNPAGIAGATPSTQVGAERCEVSITYLIIQWAQVLKTAKNSIRQANKNCDVDDDEGKHGCRCFKA